MGLDVFKKKDTEEDLVGASIKMQTVARMRQQERAQKEGDVDYEGQHYEQTIPFTIGFVIAVIIALIAMEGGSIDLSGYSLTGVRSVDGFIFGSDIYAFFGQADIDKVLTLFIRGFSYCMIAAIIPAMGVGIVSLGNKGQVNPFTACWCALLAMPLIYSAFSAWLLPSLEQLFRGF